MQKLDSINYHQLTDMDLEYYSTSSKEIKRYTVDVVDANPKIYKQFVEILNLWDSSLEDLLKKMLDIIIGFTRSEVGSIVLKTGQKLECVAFGQKRYGCILNSDGKNPLFERCLEHNLVVISNDILSDERIEQPDTFAQEHPFLTKVMVVPLQSDHSLLYVASSSNRYYRKTLRKILPFVKLISNLVSKLNGSIVPPEKAKERFLATMSHELRTPLNGILGMITLIPEAGKLTTKQKEYLRILTECALELSGLIGNILDFSKMEENKLELRQERLSIAEAVQDVVNMVHGGIVDKNIILDIDIQKIPPLLGDRQRLVQILSNLITNSIKFTEKGSIRLCIESEQIKGTNDRKIYFAVEDTGIGIPLSEQPRIFEMFHQAYNTMDYVSGTGLGLSIVKKLVEMMGGKIQVSSEGIKGKGTKFEFFIILKELQESIVLSKKIAGLLKDKKVLVVDDKQENRIHLSDILIKHGCKFHPASSAEEALAYLSYGFKFDVAIVDICMPNMSGIELAQEIKRLYPKLPLIGLSSTDISCGAEWFDVYLFKPIIAKQIIDSTVDVLRPMTKFDESYSPKYNKVSKSKLKILIAEDDKHNIFTIKEFLKSLGYRMRNVKIVENGLEVVNEVKRKPGAYHIILMDLVMPLMTGEDAAREIKAMENPPMIIAVSAAVQPHDKSRCQNAGIDGYLAKPIERDRLRAALVPLLKEKK